MDSKQYGHLQVTVAYCFQVGPDSVERTRTRCELSGAIVDGSRPIQGDLIALLIQLKQSLGGFYVQQISVSCQHSAKPDAMISA
ncbi:hypothetical protein D3C85_1477940 [compost metagenome]